MSKRSGNGYDQMKKRRGPRYRALDRRIKETQERQARRAVANRDELAPIVWQGIDQLGISQNALAASAGLSSGTLSGIMTGRRNTTAATAAKIFGALTVLLSQAEAERQETREREAAQALMVAEAPTTYTVEATTPKPLAIERQGAARCVWAQASLWGGVWHRCTRPADPAPTSLAALDLCEYPHPESYPASTQPIGG